MEKNTGSTRICTLVVMRGDIGAVTIKARDIRAKMNFVKHIYDSQNILLNNVLESVMQNNHPYGKEIQKYLDILNLDQCSRLKELSEEDIRRKVENWEAREWIRELNQKSTLTIYRENKSEIKEETFYGNDLGSILLFKARANCLKLGWKNCFQGGPVECKLCGAPEETLDHFIVECQRLQHIRLEYELETEPIQDILGFNGNINIEKKKRFLTKIWMERKRIITQERGNN